MCSFYSFKNRYLWQTMDLEDHVSPHSEAHTQKVCLTNRIGLISRNLSFSWLGFDLSKDAYTCYRPYWGHPYLPLISLVYTSLSVEQVWVVFLPGGANLYQRRGRYVIQQKPGFSPCLISPQTINLRL